MTLSPRLVQSLAPAERGAQHAEAAGVECGRRLVVHLVARDLQHLVLEAHRIAGRPRFEAATTAVEHGRSVALVEAAPPGDPRMYFRFKEQLPQLRLMIERGDLMGALRLVEPFGVEPLDLATAMRLQLRALELGLECVNEE